MDYTSVKPHPLPSQAPLISHVIVDARSCTATGHAPASKWGVGGITTQSNLW